MKTLLGILDDYWLDLVLAAAMVWVVGGML